MNPLDWAGPSFLQFYLAAIAAALVAAWALRLLLREPGDEPGVEIDGLDPYEVAYLAGGLKTAVNAALVSLVQQGALDVNGRDRRFSCIGALPGNVHPLERVIYQSVSAQ